MDDELTGLWVTSLISDVCWQPEAVDTAFHSTQLRQSTHTSTKITLINTLYCNWWLIKIRLGSYKQTFWQTASYCVDHVSCGATLRSGHIHSSFFSSVCHHESFNNVFEYCFTWFMTVTIQFNTSLFRNFTFSLFSHTLSLSNSNCLHCCNMKIGPVQKFSNKINQKKQFNLYTQHTGERD